MKSPTPSPISDQAAGDTREARLEKLVNVLDVFIAKQDEEWRYANRDLTMAFVDVVFAKEAERSTAPTTGSAPFVVDQSDPMWAKHLYENMRAAYEVYEKNPPPEQPASPAASVPVARVVRMAGTSTGIEVAWLKTPEIGSLLYAAPNEQIESVRILRAIVQAVESGENPALILDENSPLMDEARSALLAASMGGDRT